MFSKKELEFIKEMTEFYISEHEGCKRFKDNIEVAQRIAIKIDTKMEVYNPIEMKQKIAELKEYNDEINKTINALKLMQCTSLPIDMERLLGNYIQLVETTNEIIDCSITKEEGELLTYNEE